MTIENLSSKDGTTIVVERSGASGGPAVVLIAAGPVDRNVNAPLAALLAGRFTVHNYDRRGHGESGDAPSYTVDREYEDLAAVIEAAGGSASVFGTSGGAVIALEAAARGLPIEKLALWEPPYLLDDETTRPRPPADYEAQLAVAVAAGRPGDAVELFLSAAVNLPAPMVEQIKGAPFWPGMCAAAQGLIYDAAILGDFRPPVDRLGLVTVPTLVLDGGTVPSMARAADAVAAAVPGATRRTLAGQPHNVDPAVLMPVVAEFLASA